MPPSHRGAARTGKEREPPPMRIPMRLPGSFVAWVALAWRAAVLAIAADPSSGAGALAEEAAAHPESAAIAALRARLGSGDVHTRLLAVQEIGRTAGEEGLPLLQLALSDPEEGVRAAAVSYYAKTVGPVCIPLLTPLAKDKSTAVIHEILSALDEWRTPEATSLFLEILKDGPPTLRSYAIGLLEGWDDPQIVPVVLELARSDPSPLVRRGALYVLRHMKNAEALDLSKGIVANQGDYLVREAAAQYLVFLGCDVARPILVPALADKDAGFREAVATSLANNCGESVVPDFVQMLKWEAEAVKPERAGNPAVAALSDAALDVRLTALRALGKSRDRKATAPVSKLLLDKDPLIRSEAAATLGLIGDPDALPSLIGVAGDPDTLVKERVAQALGGLPTETALEPLKKLSGDGDPEVRLAAVQSLGTIGSPRARETLESALKDADSRVRAAAREALAHLSPPSGKNPRP